MTSQFCFSSDFAPISRNPGTLCNCPYRGQLCVPKTGAMISLFYSAFFVLRQSSQTRLKPALKGPVKQSKAGTQLRTNGNNWPI